MILVENNGKAKSITGKEMYNQCLWISICDYLKTIDIVVSVYELRQIACLTHHTQRSLWDEDKPWAVPALLKVCSEYNLMVEFYYIQEIEGAYFVHEDWIIKEKPVPRLVIGEGERKVCIGNYDEHFELITSF